MLGRLVNIGSVSTHQLGYSSFQLLGFRDALMLKTFKRVRLNRSTIPFDCGWYGVVRVFCMLRILHNSRNSSDSKLRPWSVCTYSGVPKFANIFIY